MNVQTFVIVMQLCTVGTVENMDKRWSNPKATEIYRLECIQAYKDCDGLNMYACTEKRLELLKAQKD